MKILKDTKTALLLKSFLFENEDRLAISILYYFDFNNPYAPLEEQAMYRETKELLGKTLLDYAMPKLKAEVLLCGSCYNYETQQGASHVKLKVGGDIEKELYVFGERRWRNGIITDPLPFKTMPIDYAHAVKNGDLLPNVEDPKYLITSKDEKVYPASFMPIDMLSQENMKKLGTFDDSYKRELWPGFAADMDYSFFNVAPQGQIQDAFFEGGEKIELLNMHPQKQRLSSHIPQIFFRCFATKTYPDREDEFIEVKLQRDTLWLFPEIEKGIVIFRGTLKTADEIYSDIKYLNIKPVFEDDTPKTPEEYYALQKKELNKSVEFDKTPFLEMDKKIAEAQKEVFNIPRYIKEGLQKAKGKRPTLKTMPMEKAIQGSKQIDDAIDRIDNAKIKFLEMKEKFGHIMKIDTAFLDNTREKLLKTKIELSNSLKKLEESSIDVESIKADALKKIDKIKSNPKLSDEAREKINTEFYKPKEKTWSDYAFEFLSGCVKTMGKDPQELHKLRHLGLTRKTISRAWIGVNTEAQILKADEWKVDSKEDITLPKGLVTARFEEANLKALRIDGKPVLGSDEAYELFLSEGNYNFPLFYFEDELQAHLCDQEAFDICNTLVCNDISSVGKITKEALQKASVIFYLQENGTIEILPKAKKFDCGEYGNLFELHQNGMEIRDQIVKNLPQDIKDELQIKRDISTKSILEKSKEISNTIEDELKTKAKAARDRIEKKRDEMLSKINSTLKSKGLDPIETKPHIPSNGFIKSSEVAKHFDKIIEKLKSKDGQKGIDLKESIAKLELDKEKMVAMTKRGEKRYESGMKKIAEVKERAKDPIPKWAKEMMLKAGLDPENPHTTALTREKVIELHKEGKSFKSKNISGLDLSDLDLSGIDLTQANCNETDFTNTNLSGANLKQTNCTKANFTKTDLGSAKANMTIFKKAKFEKTVFNNIEINNALFDSTAIKDSLFDRAILNGAVFKEMVIDNTVFKYCDFIQAAFLKSTLQKSNFSDSTFKKSIFSESDIHNCAFLNIDADAMLFNKTKVIQCDFLRAKLNNLRLLKQSTLQQCNLSYAIMQKSSIFEAFMDDCQLQKADLSKSMIRQSQINGCNFNGVIAKGSRFEYAMAKNCSFIGINLLRGSLRRMDLKFCDFSNSNLYGVEFYKTKFYEVKLDGANLKRSSLEHRTEFIYD